MIAPGQQAKPSGGIILLCLLLTACVDADPFGFGRATVVDPYQLEQSEMGDYYYLVGGEDSGGYGALDSTVGLIGWNERYILVWQTGDGLRDGWRIVDAETEVVGNYLTESEAESDPRVVDVNVMSADEAWDLLQ